MDLPSKPRGRRLQSAGIVNQAACFRIGLAIYAPTSLGVAPVRRGEPTMARKSGLAWAVEMKRSGRQRGVSPYILTQSAVALGPDHIGLAGCAPRAFRSC